MRRRVMLAALAIVLLLTEAPHRARSQVHAPWLGQLTVVNHAHFDSIATSTGTDVERASTNCAVVYLKTYQVSRAVLDYSFEWLRQSALPNGRVKQKIYIEVRGHAESTFDPRFEVTRYGAKGFGYQLSHVSYNHWFSGSKTTTAGSPPVSVRESYSVQTDCKDPLLVTVEHGPDGGFSVPLKGGFTKEGRFGQSTAELGTQNVTWDIRNGAIFKNFP